MKAEGKRYEKKVGKSLLGPWCHSQGALYDSSVWFEFLDADGRGVCEVDHLILLPDRVVVVECKLTQTPRGISQLTQLYLPVVRKVFSSVPVQGVMVCKKLYEAPEILVTSGQELLALKPSDPIPTWHWLGG